MNYLFFLVSWFMIKEELVFIIDDDLIQNEIHALLLGKIYPGVKVRTFSSATVALKAIDANSLPIVIFLDIHMPGESDTFFLDAHKDRGLASEIYLISSLAYYDNPQLFATYPAVKDFISKPLHEHKIKAVFNEYA